MRFLARNIITDSGVARNAVATVSGRRLSIAPFERETEATRYVGGTLIAVHRRLPHLYRCSDASTATLSEWVKALPLADEIGIMIVENNKGVKYGEACSD